ncbi:hypothetical protein PROFUN_02991 [Planoprotostelium fungivorum]|uniref:Uncharacterized protein n=1 Tax=Planoprotostelium fungivorum TaxID=1890364 RepID=A0A2P6NX92_9EUKA|nr:hypothetical protein PROFUN_02991 [Planoprotostelium fungivorum]
MTIQKSSLSVTKTFSRSNSLPSVGLHKTLSFLIPSEDRAHQHLEVAIVGMRSMLWHNSRLGWLKETIHEGTSIEMTQGRASARAMMSRLSLPLDVAGIHHHSTPHAIVCAAPDLPEIIALNSDSTQSNTHPFDIMSSNSSNGSTYERVISTNLSSGLYNDRAHPEMVNGRMRGSSNGLDTHAIRPFADALRGAFGYKSDHPYGDLK